VRIKTVILRKRPLPPMSYHTKAPNQAIATQMGDHLQSRPLCIVPLLHRTARSGTRKSLSKAERSCAPALELVRGRAGSSTNDPPHAFLADGLIGMHDALSTAKTHALILVMRGRSHDTHTKNTTEVGACPHAGRTVGLPYGRRFPSR
jgi:hypothetical protein